MALDSAEAAHGSYPKRIWKLVAFLGRYGHQPADVVLRLPVSDLVRLAEAVGEYLDAESASMRGPGG